jgi:uncharacterized membrane protein YkgB
MDNIFENKSTSVLTLQGNGNERGTYVCRWNNSRGEARHRNFIVQSSLERGNTLIVVAAFLIGLFAIGMGIGIKFYFDKVTNQLTENRSYSFHYKLRNSNNFKEKTGRCAGEKNEWRSRQNRSGCSNGLSIGIPALR